MSDLRASTDRNVFRPIGSGCLAPYFFTLRIYLSQFSGSDLPVAMIETPPGRDQEVSPTFIEFEQKIFKYLWLDSYIFQSENFALIIFSANPCPCVCIWPRFCVSPSGNMLMKGRMFSQGGVLRTDPGLFCQAPSGHSFSPDPLPP